MPIRFEVGDIITIRGRENDTRWKVSEVDANGRIIEVNVAYNLINIPTESKPRWVQDTNFTGSRRTDGWDGLIFMLVERPDQFSLGKYTKVILKIREMEAKRKELGYAF